MGVSEALRFLMNKWDVDFRAGPLKPIVGHGVLIVDVMTELMDYRDQATPVTCADIAARLLRHPVARIHAMHSLSTATLVVVRDSISQVPAAKFLTHAARFRDNGAHHTLSNETIVQFCKEGVTVSDPRDGRRTTRKFTMEEVFPDRRGRARMLDRVFFEMQAILTEKHRSGGEWSRTVSILDCLEGTEDKKGEEAPMTWNAEASTFKPNFDLCNGLGEGDLKIAFYVEHFLRQAAEKKEAVNIEIRTTDTDTVLVLAPLYWREPELVARATVVWDRVSNNNTVDMNKFFTRAMFEADRSGFGRNPASGLPLFVFFCVACGSDYFFRELLPLDRPTASRKYLTPEDIYGQLTSTGARGAFASVPGSPFSRAAYETIVQWLYPGSKLSPGSRCAIVFVMDMTKTPDHVAHFTMALNAYIFCMGYWLHHRDLSVFYDLKAPVEPGPLKLAGDGIYGTEYSRRHPKPATPAVPRLVHQPPTEAPVAPHFVDRRIPRTAAEVQERKEAAIAKLARGQAVFVPKPTRKRVVKASTLFTGRKSRDALFSSSSDEDEGTKQRNLTLKRLNMTGKKIPQITAEQLLFPELDNE